MALSEKTFGSVATVNLPRSVLNLSHSHKTTFKHGYLIPIMEPIEVLPGDTLSVDAAMILRMMNPVTPVMDNSFIDIRFFFVPNRLVWDHWQQFCGENDTGAWTQNNAYTIPQTVNTSEVGSIGDYFGLPVCEDEGTTKVSELPLRAYFRIWNEWFRDENYQNPVLVTFGDAAQSGANYAAYPKQVSKIHDLFTSVLPAPQKGPSVNIGLAGKALVRPLNGSVPAPSASDAAVQWYSGGTVFDYTGVGSSTTTAGKKAIPINLYADLSTATATTINQLRISFATQKYYEALARIGGGRYIEFLKGIFKVDPGDARLQRTEYLGGKRIPINVDAVTSQTQSGSSTSVDNKTLLGSQGAVSKTSDSSSYFTKSFVEHGFVYAFACVRAEHTYSQGYSKFWTKKDFFDIYVPQFANIGEVPVLRKEIYADETDNDNLVFGYQEAWYDYRYKANRCTGNMRPNINGGLVTWTYADNYNNSFSCSDEFLREPRSFVDRTLNTAGSTDEYIADFFFKIKAVRPMPVYSIPGLLDH